MQVVTKAGPSSLSPPCLLSLRHLIGEETGAPAGAGGAWMATSNGERGKRDSNAGAHFVRRC
jgi:hypothetical protein